MIKQLTITGAILAAFASFSNAQALSIGANWVGQWVPPVNNFNQLSGTNPMGTGSVTCSSRARTGGSPLARALTNGSLTNGTTVNSLSSATGVRAQNFARIGGTGTGTVGVGVTLSNGPVTAGLTGSGFSGMARSSVNFQSTLPAAANLNAGAMAMAVLPPIQPTVQTTPVSVFVFGLNQSSFFYQTSVAASSTGTISGAGAAINLRSDSKLRGQLSFF